MTTPTSENDNAGGHDTQKAIVHTRAYQQELLDESLHRNVVIALDTGSGKTHIAVLRMKHEAEREPRKVCSEFIAPLSVPQRGSQASASGSVSGGFECVYTCSFFTVGQISWFIAPTVALAEQQCEVIKSAIPVSVGFVSGASEPNQWKDAQLWRKILAQHRIMVTTPQVLLDALHHVSNSSMNRRLWLTDCLRVMSLWALTLVCWCLTRLTTLSVNTRTT